MRRYLGALARAVRKAAWLTLPAVTACGSYATDGPECRPLGSLIPLPGILVETSGVAAGVRDPDLVWTHNDGRGSILYAVDHDGRVRSRFELDQPFRDWEDIARARCDLGVCLYLADTGDNAERRDNISLYRLAEPDGAGDPEPDSVPSADAARSVGVGVEHFPMVLPHGPRDIEAMYVLPPDQIFFVTKGRNHPVTVYRYPSPLRAEEIVTLVEVQRLTDAPQDVPRMVTGASATLDGSMVAIRTYESLDFFDVTEDEQLLNSNVGRVNLRTLGEAQGEGVGFGSDGTIVLSSESVLGSSPSLAFLRCNVPVTPS